MFLKKSEHKYKLRPALIRENAQPYYSPGRGWYHIYTFCPGEKNVEQLKWTCSASTGYRAVPGKGDRPGYVAFHRDDIETVSECKKRYHTSHLL